jgi:hypothetical protein
MALKIEDGRAEELVQRAKEICERFRSLPDLDTRSPEEILGYDEQGLFGEDGDFSLTDLPLVRIEQGSGKSL